MDSFPPTKPTFLEFAREYLGPELRLDPWQEQFLERLERNPRPRFVTMSTPYGSRNYWIRQRYLEPPDWRASAERMRFRLGPGDPTVYRDRTVKRGPARVLPFRR